MPTSLIRLKNDEIRKVVAQGKRKNTHNLVLFWQNTTKKHQRAIVISKQVDKRAVRRNRLRRIISEHLRENEQVLTGKTMVIKVKNSAATLEPRQLRDEVSSLLSI